MADPLLNIFVGLVFVLFVISITFFMVMMRFRRLYAAEKSSKSSLATKHGLTFEQLVPFSKDFPGDPRAFRFIGDPVDGVLFGENEITFVEFKSGASHLSNNQNKIKKLVEDKRVAWKEIR